MTVIYADVLLTCPETNEKVSLRKNCIDCKHFKHFGIQGSKIYVACKYGENQDVSQV